MFARRIRIIGLILLVVQALIFGRVIHLQLGLGPWHRAALATSDVRTRPIRAARGMIRGSDGTVLAVDRCDADLCVHYRFLERPLDDAWLERQARARLTRKEQRDPACVEQATETLRAEVLDSWNSLATLTGITASELDRRANTVQRRVDRIVQSVNRRRLEKWERDRKPVRSDDVDSRDGAESSDERSGGVLQTPIDYLHRICGWLADESPKQIANDPPGPIGVIEQDRYYPLIENISAAELIEFTSSPERFPGVRLEQRIRREYPEHELAGGVVGYIEPSDESGSDAAGGMLDSGRGLTGIEGYYDFLLAGTTGHVRERIAPKGGVPQVLGGRAPNPGHDITLTLDLQLQAFAESALDRALEQTGDGARHTGRASSGAIVALDVQTGAVLVAASAPRFDLNVAADPSSLEAQELMARSDSPLFNRVTQMSLAPGSTFKPVSALAALEYGVDPRDSYFCRGYLHTPDKFRCLVFRNAGVGHGAVAMHDALVRSCNVYFFNVAERIGPEPIVRWAESLGFGKRTGIDLAGEQAGSLGHFTHRIAGPRRSSDGESLGVAIGQGSLRATPLQVAVMMAAIANGGLRVVPHTRREAFQPPCAIDGIEPGHGNWIAEIQHALEQVVADPRGTGHEEVYLADVAIAGKTGTAQSGSQLGDHAWFAGYAPAGNPRIALVVALEHAGSGAHSAGPLARELVRKMAEFKYFPPPDRTEPGESVAAGAPLPRMH